MASLPVELNRDRRHEVRVVGSFETDGPFGVDLTNHGDGVHVHLNLAGDLARVASLPETNHYVEADSTTTVAVDVSPVDEPVAGELRIATGYGSEEVAVDVTVTPFEGPAEVEVDEDLATPSADAPTQAIDPEPEGALAGGPSLSMLAVAGLAVAVAVAVGWYVPQTPVLVGVGVVVGATLAAVALSFR
ncbi:MAG: hypothetical protein ABEJ61_06705 [Haloferacaceae archaeon]